MMSSVCTPGCTHLSAVIGGLVGKHFAHQADAQQEGAGRAADPTSTGSASAPPVTSLCPPTTPSFGPSQLPLPHLYLHHPQCSYPNTVQSCSPAVRRYVFCGRAGSQSLHLARCVASATAPTSYLSVLGFLLDRSKGTIYTLKVVGDWTLRHLYASSSSYVESI